MNKEDRILLIGNGYVYAYTYHFWDMDGDGYPELGIRNHYQLNEDGETVCETFLTTGNYNDGIGPYLVMLPIYADRELETHIPEEIKRQGIYAEEEKQWYFRITEEQFNELRAPYWEADEQAEEMIKKVTYTYEELFEDQAYEDIVSALMKMGRISAQR